MGTCNFGLSFNFGSNLPEKYKEIEEDRNFLFSVIETVGKEKYIIKTVKREIMNGLSNSQTNSIIDEEALKYVSSGKFGKAAEEYKKLEDINTDEFDVLVLPGGYPGYVNLGNSQKILNTIKNFDSQKKIICAICGSPSVLAKAGILDERKATIYPGMEKEIPRPRGEKVVVDENVITSQGPGTAVDFVLKIVEVLLGKHNSERLKRELAC